MNYNVNEIVAKVVLKIKNMDNDTKNTISSIVDDSNIDSKTMFKVYDEVIRQLKEENIYLNFGEYENQRVGLPFNIPFIKGYIKNITITSRIYNGHYSKGSIFTNNIELKLAGGNATTKLDVSFCIDEKIKDKAVISLSIPFSMTNDDLTNLNNIINEIENKYSLFNKEENTQQFNTEYYEYVEVKINENTYLVKNNDEILAKLRIIMRENTLSNSLSKLIDDISQ